MPCCVLFKENFFSLSSADNSRLDVGLLKIPLTPPPPFSLVSFDSLEDTNLFEIFDAASNPNGLSATTEKADDEEEEGIMTDDEDDLDIGADEELPDNDAGDSLLYELVTSTPQVIGETDPEELCVTK